MGDKVQTPRGPGVVTKVSRWTANPMGCWLGGVMVLVKLDSAVARYGWHGSVNYSWRPSALQLLEAAPCLPQ